MKTLQLRIRVGAVLAILLVAGAHGLSELHRHTSHMSRRGDQGIPDHTIYEAARPILMNVDSVVVFADGNLEQRRMKYYGAQHVLTPTAVIPIGHQYVRAMLERFAQGTPVLCNLDSESVRSETGKAFESHARERGLSIARKRITAKIDLYLVEGE